MEKVTDSLGPVRIPTSGPAKGQVVREILDFDAWLEGVGSDGTFNRKLEEILTAPRDAFNSVWSDRCR